MNRDYILFNLREASEDLNGLLNEVANGNPNDVDEASLKSRLAHIYHHINFSWNSRHAPDDQLTNLSEESFELWRRFPPDVVE